MKIEKEVEEEKGQMFTKQFEDEKDVLLEGLRESRLVQSAGKLANLC